MTQATWGTVTAKPEGGSSDPNVLKLTEATRIRLLEPFAERWRQHGIQAPDDEEKFDSVVCPRGPDGRDQEACPLCMKPADAEGNQRFPVSRRSATNVWDYESGSVKVLIGGPQIFQPFDEAAQVGIDPTSCDWVINKTGEKRNTKYKMVRLDAAPFSAQVGPDDLHDLSKYAQKDSTEKIFEKLEAVGIDYDSLETPHFDLDKAEAFPMPFGKHKGSTIEQVYHSDKDYLLFIHNSKLDQGNYGDTVFAAIHAVLEHYGDVEPIDEMPSVPPRPAASANGSGSTPQAAPAPTPAPAQPAGMVALIGPDGNEVQVPEAAKAALLATGFTEPQPEPVAVAPTTLVGPDGAEIDASALPEAAVAAMLAAGYSWKQEGAPVEATPPEPALAWPADDEQVMVKLKVVPTPVPMAFKDAKPIVRNGQGEIVDNEPLNEAIRAEANGDAQAEAVREAARNGEVEQPSPQARAAESGDPLSPDLTAGPNEAGEFTHPALDKSYKTKGAVTQALNRMKSSGQPAPPASTSAAAPAAGSAAPAGEQTLLDRAKTLLQSSPKYTSDFKVMLELFQEVAGKRQISEFTEAELQALVERLESEA